MFVLYMNHIHVVKFTFVNRCFFSQLLLCHYIICHPDIQIDTHILVNNSLFTSKDALFSVAAEPHTFEMLIPNMLEPFLSLADD